MNTKAQATIEFTLVFIVLLALFLALIELGLFWKGRYSAETVANEMLANAQLASIPPVGSTSCEAADVALEVLKHRGGLFLLDSQDFMKEQDGMSFAFMSADKVFGEPKLVLNVNCENIREGQLELSLIYRYHGMLVYSGGINIQSVVNASSQKY